MHLLVVERKNENWKDIWKKILVSPADIWTADLLAQIWSWTDTLGCLAISSHWQTSLYNIYQTLYLSCLRPHSHSIWLLWVVLKMARFVYFLIRVNFLHDHLKNRNVKTYKQKRICWKIGPCSWRAEKDTQPTIDVYTI